MSAEATVDHSYDEEHHLPAPLVYSMSKLGMWLFLATEVLLFAGLFTTFAVYRLKAGDMFKETHKLLSVPFGTANTILLLASSFTVAWAVDAIKRNKQQLVNWLLVITIALGAAFMVNKYFEYSHKIHPTWVKASILAQPFVKALDRDGKCVDPKGDVAFAKAKAAAKKAGKEVPEQPLMTNTKECEVIPMNLSNVGIGVQAADRPVFMNTFIAQYVIMTGIHGLHIIIGLGIFVWILILSFKGRISNRWFTPIELGGLYWHLVDLIWIYLFPMLYLVS